MKLLILYGIFGLLATDASGLMCEQCTSLEDKTVCIDPYVTDNLGECDDDQYCVKYKTVVWIRDSGYITGWKRPSAVITRTCEPRQGKSEGCYGKQNNGGILIKCYCGTDGCNSASLPSSVKLLVTAACLLVFSSMWLRH